MMRNDRDQNEGTDVSDKFPVVTLLNKNIVVSVLLRRNHRH